MANPHPTPPPARYRFTKEDAAHYGARGAAERERRFLERFPDPNARSRAERERLWSALSILRAVYCPQTRLRRRPYVAPAFAPVLLHAVDMLIELLDSKDERIALRASEAVGWYSGFLPQPSRRRSA
jgi:hypothetical protein